MKCFMGCHILGGGTNLYVWFATVVISSYNYFLAKPITVRAVCYQLHLIYLV